MLCLDGRSLSVPGACPLRRGDRATCGAMPYNTRGGLPGGTRFCCRGSRHVWRVMRRAMAAKGMRHGARSTMSLEAMSLEDMISERTHAAYSYVTRAQSALGALGRLDVVRDGDRLVLPAREYSRKDWAACTGAEICQVGSFAPEAFEQASIGHTGGLFWLVPTVGESSLRVADIRALSARATAVGAALIVDNSVPLSYGSRPLDMGASLCLESLVGVAETPVAPVVSISLARPRRHHRKHRVSGLDLRDLVREGSQNLVAPDDETVRGIVCGIETLSIRSQMRMDHARALAEYFRANRFIEQVIYPGLASHPDHMAATSVLLHGFGPLLDVVPGDSCDASALVAELGYGLSDAFDAHALYSFGLANANGEERLRIVAGLGNPLVFIDCFDRLLSEHHC